MLEESLTNGLDTLGLAWDAETPQRFRRYYTLLQETNAVMNLTAISGEEETVRLHFLDSASPLLLFSMEGAAVIDVGTGAGFPGFPLKLLRPDISLTLLDSQRKRVDFLNRVSEDLGLSNVRCVHRRAEDCGDDREHFDFAVSRAVARLNILCELCLPYVRLGGFFLALKGPAALEEVREAEQAIKQLGGRLEQVFNYTVPGAALHHNIVVVRKKAPTLKKYPRPFGQIKKNPL